MPYRDSDIVVSRRWLVWTVNSTTRDQVSFIKLPGLFEVVCRLGTSKNRITSDRER